MYRTLLSQRPANLIEHFAPWFRLCRGPYARTAQPNPSRNRRLSGRSAPRWQARRAAAHSSSTDSASSVPLLGVRRDSLVVGFGHRAMMSFLHRCTICICRTAMRDARSISKLGQAYACRLPCLNSVGGLCGGASTPAPPRPALISGKRRSVGGAISQGARIDAR